MSFEIATVLAISGVLIFLAYMAVNSNLQPHIRSFFVFMTFFGMIILVNEARILARDATSTNTNLDTVLQTTHVFLMWFFGFIMATYAILQFVRYLKDGKIGLSEDKYRTR